MPSNSYDVSVIGGGIVGLATAWALRRRYPERPLALLEKEPSLASHQTGHNSGVIHSGVYYRPGSLKALLCVRGAAAMKDFCQRNGIPVRACGKVIVAGSQAQCHQLAELYRRGKQNGVPGLSLIGPGPLKELEPHAAGIQALHVPGAAVVDFRQVAIRLAQQVRHAGGQIFTRTRVLRIRSEAQGLHLETTQGDFKSRFLINCAGLYSDRLARSCRRHLPLAIVPFRGEYWELIPERRHLVRGLLYPVPDPRFPFLGVHCCRTIEEKVQIGPNAVLALHRQGYRRRDVHLRDLWEMLTFPGFWKMAARYGYDGLGEMIRSLSKRVLLHSVRRLLPSIEGKDMIPSARGVRAQALSREGELLDDFHLMGEERTLHVCNAPSPAATASLAIGEYLSGHAARQFGF